MSLMIFDVCTNPNTYTNLGKRIGLATSTLRMLPVNRKVELNNEGIPIVPEGVDNRIERQKAVDSYAAGLYELNEPLEELLQVDKRGGLNDEIIRFSKDTYFDDETKDEATALSSQFLDSLKKAEEYKRSLGYTNEFNNESLTEVESGLPFLEQNIPTSEHESLGLTSMDYGRFRLLLQNAELLGEERNEPMPNGPLPNRTKDEAWRSMSEKRRAFARFSNIRKYFPQFAIWGLLSADPGYITSILSSYGTGLRHQNEFVRLGTVNLFKGLAYAIPQELEGNLQECHRLASLIIGKAKEEVLKEGQQFIYQDALTALAAIIAPLNYKHLGANDRNQMVSQRASILERQLLNLYRLISTAQRQLNN